LSQFHINNCVVKIEEKWESSFNPTYNWSPPHSASSRSQLQSSKPNPTAQSCTGQDSFDSAISTWELHGLSGT